MKEILGIEYYNVEIGRSVPAKYAPLFAVPPELAPTLLAVHGGLAASPQRRPRCGAAWDQNIFLLDLYKGLGSKYLSVGFV